MEIRVIPGRAADQTVEALIMYLFEGAQLQSETKDADDACNGAIIIVQQQAVHAEVERWICRGCAHGVEVSASQPVEAVGVFVVLLQCLRLVRMMVMMMVM